MKNVEIVRDHVHIRLASGTIQFFRPVNGIVFAAAFDGNGRIDIDPPNPNEAQQLRLFIKQDKMSLTFSEAEFTFTDGLLNEADRQVKWQGADNPAFADAYARRKRERDRETGDTVPRLLEAVLSPDAKRTAYFQADLKTHEKGWISVTDDALQPEEILVTSGEDIWLSFPAGGRDPRHVFDDPAERLDYLIPSYKISSTLAESGEMSATAQVTVAPRFSGESVLLFSLDPNLRISSVKDSKGNALAYTQADDPKGSQWRDGDYVAVLLARPIAPPDSEAIEFTYAGKHVVTRVGDGNYFCRSFGWYPSLYSNRIGVDALAFRSDFDLTFRNPKHYELVATGNKVSDTVDGKERVTNWQSAIPLAAAGFAFGEYKTYSETVNGVEVQVYANERPDDQLRSIQGAAEGGDLPSRGGDRFGRLGSFGPQVAIGTLSAAALVKTIGIETGNTLKVFENYYGPYPYKTLAVTNIVGSYGQGWPGLLYLSWLTFLDSTQRHALGVSNQVRLTDFFRGHEASHQWWGHRVGWKSYHDQWLSEGFAEFSGLLYVQYREKPEEFFSQLRMDKDLLRGPDRYGHVVDDLAPIWMGRRIRSSQTAPSSYQNLVYSKGAYVLQMLRMQLFEDRNPDRDHRFKAMMQDYCKTFDNKPASTEDFKAVVERHMLRGMDLDGNHKMDWFFNQYVYGTGMPHYQFRATAEPVAGGKTHITGELTRSGVPDGWKDAVTIYAHVGNNTVRLGTLAATHDREPVDVTVNGKIDRVSINDYEDLYADVKQ